MINGVHDNPRCRCAPCLAAIREHLKRLAFCPEHYVPWAGHDCELSKIRSAEPLTSP